MFTSPTFRAFNHQNLENKDAQVSRKPGLSISARKPLTDRSVNASKTLKPEFSKPNTSKEAMTSLKKPTIKPKEYQDWYQDICSFKEVKDTYEDILPKSQRFTKADIVNIIKPPKTPPFKGNFEIDPMVLELPPAASFFASHHEIVPLKEIPVEDMEMPDFDLIF